VAKLAAHWMTINYRESYNLFACGGILFNHESPLRGREFVTRKITSELALIKQGRKAPLELGNMDAKRDWGFAGDYVLGMWLMLQQDEPEDYVLATGESHTVRDFINIAAPHYGFNIEWNGSGAKETGIDRKTGKTIIRINKAFYRPAEVEALLGNPENAEKKLGWKRAIDFSQMVENMAKADLDRAARGSL
jgi:GDPmannose 4,6-dehydratase